MVEQAFMRKLAATFRESGIPPICRLYEGHLHVQVLCDNKNEVAAGVVWLAGMVGLLLFDSREWRIVAFLQFYDSDPDVFSKIVAEVKKYRVVE